MLAITYQSPMNRSTSTWSTVASGGWDVQALHAIANRIAVADFGAFIDLRFCAFMFYINS
jgi:hypothetical protein